MKSRFSRKKVARSTALSAFVLLIAGSVIVANYFNASAASQTLIINTSDLQKPLADCIVEGYGNGYGLKPHTGNTLTITTSGEGEEEVINITYDDASDYILDCSDKGLSAVPSINLLKNIKLFWVDLSDNANLNDIRGLADFGNIDTINLSNTGIQYDENTLDALSGHNLQRLYLDNANVDNQAIVDLGNRVGTTLKSLNLANNGLEHVTGFNPDYYEHRFGRLEELDLSDNDLLDIDDLEPLTNLKNLYVQNNSLEALPISNLIALEYIDASENFIEELTSSLKWTGSDFVNNTTVKTMILNQNRIPKSEIVNFEYYTALENLDLSRQIGEDYGEITTYETYFLPNIRNLEMTHLGITSFDCTFLTNLESIDLSYNNLTTAASIYGDNLTSVNLFSNRIEDFGNHLDYFSTSYEEYGNQYVEIQADSRKNIELPASVSDFKDTIDAREECYDCTITDNAGHITVSMADGKTEATYILFADESDQKSLIWVDIEASAASYIVNYSFNGGEATNYQNGIQDNGSVLADVNTVRYGSETVSRDGYSFLGWAKNSNAASAEYQKGDTIEDLAFGNDGVVNLYAVWRQDQSTEPTETYYYITYNVNGGDYNPRVNPNGNYNFSSTRLADLQTVKGIALTRSGYSFKGWSIHRNAVTATFEAGDHIDQTYFTNNGNHPTLYAVWWKDAEPSTQPDTCGLYVHHYKKGTTQEIAAGISTQHYCNNIQTTISLNPTLLSQGYTFDSATLSKGGDNETLTESSFPLRLVNEAEPTILNIYYSEPQEDAITQPDTCSISIHHYKVGSTEELDAQNAPSLTHYCGNFQTYVYLSNIALHELGLVYDSATLKVNDKTYNLDESQFPFQISNYADSVELTILYKVPSSIDPSDDNSGNSDSSSDSDTDSATTNANTGDKIAKIAFPGIGIIAIAGFALVKMIRRR